MKELTKIILIIGSIPVLIAALYALRTYKQVNERLKLFYWFLFLSCIIEIGSTLLWFLKKNNLPLLHIYVAGGFIIMGLFYKKTLSSFIKPKIFNLIILLFTAFTLINTLFFQKILTFNTYALTTESILLIIFSLCWFVFSMNSLETTTKNSDAVSINWINSGILVYYTSSVLIFYYEDIISHFSVLMSRYAWIGHTFFSVTMYTCFFIAIWKRPKN